MFKKTIIHIAIIVLILFISAAIVRFFMPFYWGDATQTVKYEYYEKNAEKYNAVYLGGSLEYRHIDPSIIDSVAQKNGIDFHSFNLGIDGHGIIQQLNDLEGLLKIRNPNLKYVFLSISSESYFFKANLHTPKWISWHTATSTYNALNLTSTLDDPLKFRTKFSGFWLSSWIENLFNIGTVPDMLKYKFDKSYLDTSYVGKNKDGFYPYDYEESHLFMEYKWEDTLLLESRHRFEKSDPYTDTLNKNVLNSFSNYKATDVPNKVMTALYLDAYKKCKKKGIQVFFVLPPKARTSYSLLLPVFNAMPEGSKIELADIRKYPKFYSIEYGYNFHHLNYKGARLCSQELAKQLIPLLKSEENN
ncbi:MAG TPA: hypothetical protein PKK18_05785 [Chitinophagales bacterium]|nr:hypothetical protein [Chitinophagales bacterium]HNA39827.1 hypothetical protein [Chitinophagales bacterium]HNB47861.1 hypothetical protein [Chitinophagales bacterium]HNF52040.1 hypothetical protein [Chitinophagales bacterium]HNK12377.1 hypothetical protein [Chitinophagales bacterium]